MNLIFQKPSIFFPTYIKRLKFFFQKIHKFTICKYEKFPVFDLKFVEHKKKDGFQGYPF